VRPALLRAYRRTSYVAAGTTIRIGRRSLAMDHLLLTRGARTAAFITACNPRSRPMPPAWNRRMQKRLRIAVRRHPVLPADGRWRRWCEAHLLVFADPRPMRKLARIYRQNAIVIVRLRQPAQLAPTLYRDCRGP
jgi:Protein of unknown function (DUF3293)